MKIFNLKIAVILFLSFSLLGCAQTTKTDIVRQINPVELNEKLGDNIQLIDCRTPKEFAEGHLKGAKIINYYDSDFLNEMSKLDKDKVLYIYCRSGNRSGKAAKKLETMGFTKIYDLKGGIISWKKNNLEIVK
ncbi:MAG: rhodanese-like domain-containing protein [Flavobacteriaceae bacterium]|nr:rhodanese-like domain-containing protein [Flavobacteriaceae bacterium]